MPTCTLCDQETDTLYELAESCALQLIRDEHPDWVQEDGACPICRAYYESFDEVIAVAGSDEE